MDITKFYQNKKLINVAWKADNADPWSTAWDSATRSLTYLLLQDQEWGNNWHVRPMDWDLETIYLYVDDVLMSSLI